MQKFLEPYAKTYKLHNCTDNDDRVREIDGFVRYAKKNFVANM